MMPTPCQRGNCLHVNDIDRGRIGPFRRQQFRSRRQTDQMVRGIG